MSAPLAPAVDGLYLVPLGERNAVNLPDRGLHSGACSLKQGAGSPCRSPSDQPFECYWRIRATLPDRYGQRLRILARGTMNSALVEFTDGTRHILNRWAFRKVAA